MLNKLLRKLEESGWRTAALGDDWFDDEPQQPTAAPAVATPPPAAHTPPATPPAPQGGMRQIAPSRPAITTPYQATPPEDWESRFDMRNQIERGGLFQQWLRKNWDTDAQPPLERWTASAGADVTTEFANAMANFKMSKRTEPQNPNLAGIEGTAGTGLDERRKRQPMTPEQEAKRKQWLDDAMPFVKEFNGKHPDFFQQCIKAADIAGKRNGKEGDGSEWFRQTFYPPENINTSPDKRLRILTDPAARAELKAYQPFAEHLNQVLSQSGIGEDALNGFRGDKWRNLLNPKLFDLLDRNPSNAPNSLVDALRAVTDKQVPPALSHYWIKDAGSFGANKEDDSTGDMSYNKENEEGKDQTGILQGTRVGDQSTIDRGQVQAWLEQFKVKFEPQIKSAIQLNQKMTDKIYETINKVNKPTSDPMNISGKQVNTLDAWNVLNHSMGENMAALLDQSKMSPALLDGLAKQIMSKSKPTGGELGNQDTVGKPQGIRVTDRSVGGIGFVPNANPGAGGDFMSQIGIDLSQFVSPTKMSVGLYQMGAVKSRIYHQVFENNIVDPKVLTSEVQKELTSGTLNTRMQQAHDASGGAFVANPNRPLGFDFSESFVKSALNEILVPNPDPASKGQYPYIYDKAKAQQVVGDMESLISDSKLGGRAKAYLAHKSANYAAIKNKIIEENPELAGGARTLSNIVKTHTSSLAPFSEADWNKVRPFLPADPSQVRWEGKGSVVENMYPSTKGLDNATLQQCFKRFISEWNERPPTPKQLAAGIEPSTAAKLKQEAVAQNIPDVKGYIEQGMQRLQPELDQKYPLTANIKGQVAKDVVERLRLEKKLKGRIPSRTLREAYQQSGNPIPPYIEQWLNIRDGKMGVDTNDPNKQYARKRKTTHDHLRASLQRALLAYRIRSAKVNKLAAIRDSLVKVGSTPRLDKMLEFERLEARKLLTACENLMGNLPREVRQELLSTTV